MEKITKDEIVMLQYFWEEKGNIERYIGFEVLKPKLEKQFPEVLKAWNDYKASERILDAVMSTLTIED